MAFLKMIFSFLLLLAGIWFAVANLESVAIHNPVNGSFYTLPLSVVVLASIGVGIVLWGVVSFFGSLGLRAEIRKMQRVNRELKDELTRLRNLSVLEDHEVNASVASRSATDAAAPTTLPATQQTPSEGDQA